MKHTKLRPCTFVSACVTSPTCRNQQSSLAITRTSLSRILLNWPPFLVRELPRILSSSQLHQTRFLIYKTRDLFKTPDPQTFRLLASFCSHPPPRTQLEAPPLSAGTHWCQPSRARRAAAHSHQCLRLWKPNSGKPGKREELRFLLDNLQSICFWVFGCCCHGRIFSLFVDPRLILSTENTLRRYRRSFLCGQFRDPPTHPIRPFAQLATGCSNRPFHQPHYH